MKILILGGSAWIGRRLFARVGPERAVATFCKTPLPGGVRFDATTDRVERLLGPAPGEFSHAVILLGDTKPESCAADPAVSNALNVVAIRTIVDDLLAFGVLPVFLSTEFVFDGRKGSPYVEEDRPNPLMLYGEQKVVVEDHLMAAGRPSLIVRLAKVYGDEPGDGTLFSAWIDAIERGETIRCAEDQVLSPIFVDEVVEALVLLLECRSEGIFHLAGTQPLSRWELFETLAGKLREALPIEPKVVPCRIEDLVADLGLREPRPQNISMKPDKLIRETGMKLRGAAETCERIVRKRFGPRAK